MIPRMYVVHTGCIAIPRPCPVNDGIQKKKRQKFLLLSPSTREIYNCSESTESFFFSFLNEFHTFIDKFFVLETYVSTGVMMLIVSSKWISGSGYFNQTVFRVYRGISGHGSTHF